MRKAYPVFKRNNLCFIPNTYEYVKGDDIADIMGKVRNVLEKKENLEDPLDVEYARQITVDENPLFEQCTMLYVDIELNPGKRMVTVVKPVGGRPAKKMPDTFKEDAEQHTSSELQRMYGVSRPVIKRWKKELTEQPDEDMELSKSSEDILPDASLV